MNKGGGMGYMKYSIITRPGAQDTQEPSGRGYNTIEYIVAIRLSHLRCVLCS